MIKSVSEVWMNALSYAKKTQQQKSLFREIKWRWIRKAGPIPAMSETSGTSIRHLKLSLKSWQNGDPL